MTDLAPGIVVAERFKLVRKLGEGGMGSVWLAHHVKLDVNCAVKFINADVDSGGIRERFEREAKIAAQIRSPNVVHVLDYGVSENQPYIAMELLEGMDLAQRVSDRGRLTPEETVTIVAQVARALTKAHAAGLVHRDLKPENVFLQRDDDTEVVKVLDFGIAKAPMSMSDGNTRTGAVLGTPRYMSPEQAQGLKTLDHRSDLWSLGVIAYRCLVGQLPFDSEAIGDLLMRIIVHPIPVPSQVAPWVSPSFDGWFMRAVARDPAQRFQSAKELADALSMALGIAVAMSSGRAPVPSMPTMADPRTYVPGQTPAPSYNTPAPSFGTPAPNQTPAPMHRTVHETPIGFQAPAGFSPTPNPGGPTPQPLNTPWPGQPTTPSAMMGPVPDRTMNPASRTFGAAEASKPKSSSKGILIGVVALFGVVIVVLLVMVLGKKGDAVAAGPGPSAGPTAATAAPTPQPVAVEVSPLPDPAAAAAAQAASAKVAAQPKPKPPPPPPVTVAQPPPPPPQPPPPTPVPARTGKVHL